MVRLERPTTDQVRHVLALDAAKGRTGWAIVNDQGPVAAGAFSPGDTYPFERLVAHLEALFQQVDDLVMQSRNVQGDAKVASPRLVVERPPDREPITGGRNRKNPRITLRALAEVEGACMLAGTRPGWLAPWWLKPDEWRPTAYPGLGRSRGAAGRANAKRCAQVTVAGDWPHLAAFAREDDEGDTCEAIMLGVAALHLEAQAWRNPLLAGVAVPPKERSRDVVVDLGAWA